MEEVVGTSIIDHFSSLLDPRFFLKTRHKLIDIVAITVCAMIAGADDWVEIANYGRAKKDWFKTFLELPAGIPSHDTFGRVISLIAPEEFGRCLSGWIREVFPACRQGIVAIDGKTARRSHDRANGKPPIHTPTVLHVAFKLVVDRVWDDALIGLGVGLEDSQEGVRVPVARVQRVVDVASEIEAAGI